MSDYEKYKGDITQSPAVRYQVKATNKYKVIRSGSVLEIYEYQKGVKTGIKQGGRKKGMKSIKYKSYRMDTLNKNRNYIRRLINSNFTNNAKFITLTFRDTENIDIKNLRECNVAFTAFIRRLRNIVSVKFKYMCVPEFQDKFKRGAVHYHFIADLPYINYEKLAEIWGLGFIGIEAIENHDNIGAYMSKYITKRVDDIRYEGNKSYFCSRGLDKPEKVFSNELDLLYKEGSIESILEKKEVVYGNSYNSEYQGLINYYEFNLKR
jgi:hypothetical protein